MITTTPRAVTRADVEVLLNRLHLAGASREIDVELFRLIDDRVVRQAYMLRPAILDQGEEVNELERLGAAVTTPPQVWVSETPEFDTDYFDDDGKRVFERVPFGYLRANGDFIVQPLLDPIPSFTSDIGDAIRFKHRVFGSYLLLSMKEQEEEILGVDYFVSLCLAAGDDLSSFRADTLPKAIVGVVLEAMLSGWTHELATYELI